MRVVVDVKAFYDWDPVPRDVEVTDKDIAAGRVRPNARGDGHLMRVRREKASQTTVHVAESTIIARIIHEATPQGGNRQLTRKEAVGQLLAHNVMPHHAHPRDMLGFTVDTDDGPDEVLFRQTIAAHVMSGLFDEKETTEMLGSYLKPVTLAEHVDHLHARFGVPRKAAS